MTRRTCVTCGRDTNARQCRHCQRTEFLDAFTGGTYTATYENEDDNDADA